MKQGRHRTQINKGHGHARYGYALDVTTVVPAATTIAGTINDTWEIKGLWKSRPTLWRHTIVDKYGFPWIVHATAQLGATGDVVTVDIAHVALNYTEQERREPGWGHYSPAFLAADVCVD
jgi:hypothetical protein